MLSMDAGLLVMLSLLFCELYASMAYSVVLSSWVCFRQFVSIITLDGYEYCLQ